MSFHSGFKMIPRRQGGSGGGIYEDTLSMLTPMFGGTQTQPTQVGFGCGIESACDAANRRTTRTLPNGATTNYAYDDNGRLTGITTTKSSTAIDTITYTLDGVGNRLSKGRKSGVNLHHWQLTADQRLFIALRRLNYRVQSKDDGTSLEVTKNVLWE